MKRFVTTALILLFLSLPGFSQTCAFQNLVFEGAGIRGLAYAGVIEELEKHDKLKDVQKVGGTSAGAITALMVSLGYTSEEIAEIISSTQFSRFNDGRFMFVGGLVRMNKVYGWYRGEKFTEWLGALIEQKTGNADITFEQLSQKGYKDLYVTATCLNRQQLLVFSRENYPHMKIKDAVRVSMSIPLYFQAVFIDSTGAVYKKPDKTKELDIVVDGGIIGNFPIFLFDRTETDAASLQHRIPNPQTIGVRIDTDVQIQNDASSRELVPLEINSFNDYIAAFYIFVLENLNRNTLTEADWSRTISISSVGITPRIKRLSAAQKEKLVNSGREFTAAYLSQNCAAATERNK
ncbi:patatin-like phospholipase family protein [Botryobacter ruber]|uniref:patatin-like phospholipase family protein n=1 Tax=Botryobacter ruber TaxID=2171629 RepID=UPI000E0A8559|nr:patatin-like phospholipase family protein [Botryobacter ruber]